MLIDSQLELSDDQAITATAASTNVIDLSTDNDHGVGGRTRVVAKVSEAFTADGAGTLTTTVQVSDDNSNWRDLLSTPAVGKAALLVGTKLLDLVLPPAGHVGGYRYVRLNYTVATGPMTAGKVNAMLVLDAEDHANG